LIKKQGVLYIVSTPIGNLADITFRAVEILKSVDLIAAEDTRHSKRLLDNYQIKTKMISIHQHNEASRIGFVSDRLDEGLNIALVSDAGTPLISDPGYRLVSALRERNYSIISIPGASALISALSISGLKSDKFYFEGFLSSKTGARQARLTELKASDATLIFYEAPHRLKKLISDIVLVFGANRKTCIARELTKKFETTKVATSLELENWLAENPQQLKGECVVLVEAQENIKKNTTISEAEFKLLQAIAEFAPPKAAAAIVSEYCDLSKKLLYQELLSSKQ
jgi:16S rRNA (cytidine1402-2'-O)-methyltransferase